MDYADFHNKMMELTKREQDMRSSHQTQNIILVEQHKNLARAEQDRYEEALRKEAQAYQVKIVALRNEKSHLRFLWMQACHNKGEQPYGTIDDGFNK